MKHTSQTATGRPPTEAEIERWRTAFRETVAEALADLFLATDREAATTKRTRRPAA